MADLGVATDSKAGEPAQVIVAAARRYQAGLIVMTGHATINGRKDLLGSTAHSVLKECTMPVLVLPLNATSYTRPTAVVMGHNGSAGAFNRPCPCVEL